ncbi:MAG: DUF5134 domain-containing protein [Acidimicrobiales bacterium]
MYGPAWSVDVVVAVLLCTVLYCASRLVFLAVAKRPDRRDVHVVHIVMATAMAAMLLNVFNLGPSGVWEVVFVAFAGWFLWRAIAVLRATSSSWLAVHESNHVVASVAMVAMFSGGMVMHGGSAGAMTMVMGQPVWFLPAAFVLGLSLAVYGVWNATLIVTTNSSALVAHQSCTGSGVDSATATRAVPYRSTAAPRLALCCDVVMAVSMVYMFSWVH